MHTSRRIRYDRAQKASLISWSLIGLGVLFVIAVLLVQDSRPSILRAATDGQRLHGN
ncbi:MAG: hypothetical protein ACYS22_19765 [Planctomycetota bacterium]|jgi:hypothetical protein